ncbi:unnamed protein product [Sphagnum balticum]
MWRVPMSRWKQMPGIFFFVLLVANPFARDKPEGRFLKGLMPSSAITIGLAEWGALVAILRAFFGVQRWLGGELRDVVNDGEGGGVGEEEGECEIWDGKGARGRSARLVDGE